MFLRFLGSLQLALGLFLGLALIAILGTFKPLAEGRYEIFYQSLWFRLLLALLAINLSVCTWRTIRRNLGDLGRHFDTLGTDAVLSSPQQQPVAGGDPARLAEALTQQGWRLRRQGAEWLAYRGRAGRWGSTMVHLSCLLIMLGALAAETGFVGTLNIYAGDKSTVYFDWNKQQEIPLGFDFRLDRFEPIYYPIELQFAARDRQSGQVLATYTTKEGEKVDLPVPGMQAEVRRFFHLEEELILGIYRDGTYLGDYHALGGGRSFNNAVNPGVNLRPVAFRDPILKQLHSEVSLLENGQVVRSGTIEVNQPLSYRGISIYQTAFDRDKFGLYYAGFQFSRDPGEPLVWGGCIGLCLGLLIAFAVPFRVVGIKMNGGEPLLVALDGFRGETGAILFERLAANIIEGGTKKVIWGKVFTHGND